MPNTSRMRAPSYARGNWACPHHQPHRMAHPWLWTGSIIGVSATLGATGSHAMNWAANRVAISSAGLIGGTRLPLEGASTAKTLWGTEPGAMYFSGGATERINCGGQQHGIGNGFMVAGWAKKVGDDFQLIAQDGGGRSIRHFQFRILSTGAIRFVRFNSKSSLIEAVTSSSTAFSDGKWHHAAAVFDVTNGTRLYIDGRISATSSNTTANEDQSTTDALYIGNRNASDGKSGYVDDVFMYAHGSHPISGLHDVIAQTLALRRGIAFETRRPRTFFIPPAGAAPATRLPQLALLGVG